MTTKKTKILLGLLLAMMACGDERNDNPSSPAVGKTEGDDNNEEYLALYSDLVTANADLANANQTLAVCETRVEEIETWNESLETDVDELQDDKDVYVEGLAYANAELASAEENYAVCQATLESTTTENETLNSAIAGLEGTNSTMLENWQVCENEKDGLEDEKDELESQNTDLLLTTINLDSDLLACSDEVTNLRGVVEGLEGDIDGFLVQVGGLESDIEEYRDELDRTNQEKNEAYTKYLEVDGRLDTIQNNCHVVDCFRKWGPLGEEVSGEEMFGSMVVDGEYIGRVVLSDDDLDQTFWTLQNVMDGELWVYEEPPQKLAWFWVGNEGMEVEVNGTTVYLGLKSTTDSAAIISVNGQNVMVSDGYIAYIADGGAVYVEDHVDDRAWGVYLDEDVVGRQYHYSMYANGVGYQNTLPDFSYRLLVESVSQPLSADNPFYSYVDERKTAVVDMRMRTEDGGLSTDIRSVWQGQLGEWPFLYHVEEVDSSSNKVELTVFDYSPHLESRGDSYRTDEVDEPLGSIEFDGYDGTPTIVADTACGSLTKDFLVMWEGMDPDVDCAIMEQHVVVGPTLFVRKFFGTVVALITGHDSFEVAQAAKMLKGYSAWSSSTSSGGGAGSSGGGGGTITIEEVPVPIGD